MHQEHIEEALGAASNGGRVAIYADTLNDAKAIAERFEAANNEPLERISRASGARRMDFHGGGSIHFMSLRGQSARGMVLDRAYLPIGTGPDTLVNIIPSLSTTDGALTGY